MSALKARKTTAKTVTTKKSAPAKKAPIVKDALTKSQILAHLSDATDLSKKQVSAVMDAIGMLIGASVGARGPGSFTFPAILKINVVKKAAKKARKGTNPFTGEETVFKAKPAHNVVKIRALKKLKEMVA